MTFLRKLFIKIFGIELYLTFISKIYIWLTSKGYYKKNYPELFFLEKIIKNGDTCIDIGANLGYYSVKMSKLCGATGKVYSVEPIPLFNKIWEKNVKKSGFPNLELLPYALGAEQGTVKMGMPEKNGLVHHGMTKIISSTNEKYATLFEVTMKIPNELFKNITHLDFIKCDIEGYEFIAFSNMLDIIRKFSPIIQTELSGIENRKKVIALIESEGYKTYILQNNALIPASSNDIQNHSRDFYFLQKQHSWLLN
jgi:FkbM family methyltransferase